MKFLKLYVAFSKRLLYKPSFLIVLLLIPLLVLASYFSTSNEEKGLVTIAVATEDSDCPIFSSINDELKRDSSAIVYKVYDSRESAISSVADGTSAYAWIFKENLLQRMSDYASGVLGITLCEVVCKEETMLSLVTTEKLYSVLYKHLSKSLFLDFMKERNIDHENANEKYLSNLFDEYKENIQPDLIDFAFLDNDEKEIKDINYLISPLKGLLAACLLVCCLAAMMYSLDDERVGKYAMFPLSSRLFLHFLAVLSAGILVSVAIYISLCVSNLINSALIDALQLMLYALSSTSFCVFLGIVLKKSSSLCIFLPVIVVLTISLCPVFVNVHGFNFIKNLLPSYHYLKSSEDTIKIAHMTIYLLSVTSIDIIAYKSFTEKYKNKQ